MSSSASSASEPLYLALDLGSNSFHLLLATFRQGKMVRLDRRKESVKLASGLSRDGMLSDEAQQRALDTLRAFRPVIGDLPRSHVRVVGTNTLRAARNAEPFLSRAREVLGYPIHIISGIEEARLIYLGVAKDLAPPEGQRLVVDIGGGSTEVVLGDIVPRQLESLYMGCVSWTQRFFPDGELNPSVYKSAVRAARRELLGVAGQLGEGAWDDAVGSSGTIRAIGSCLSEAGQQQITHAGIKRLRDQLLAYRHIREISIPGMSRERAEVLPGGLAILDGLFRELRIEAMDVSDYAIREGIIHDLAGRFHHRDKRQETMEGMMAAYHVDLGQAQRVSSLAVRLWRQLKEAAGDTGMEKLRWAANLHEIGLAISHAGYQKHGAYILQYAEMPGFSRQEQLLLSFLVLNHRRRLKPMGRHYGFDADWPMVLCLRLACIFARPRREIEWPSLSLRQPGKESFELSLDGSWLTDHPLLADDLMQESRHWERLDYTLDIAAMPAPR